MIGICFKASKWVILQASMPIMKHAFSLSHFPDAHLELEFSIWTGKSTLWFNGIPYRRSSDKGAPFIIPTESGEVYTLYPKIEFPDIIPTLEINGLKHRIVDRLPWYEYALAMLPMLLLFLGGGVIGGAIGGGTSYLNIYILRTEDSNLAKYIKLIGLSFFAYLLYNLLAHMVHQL